MRASVKPYIVVCCEKTVTRRTRKSLNEELILESSEPKLEIHV
jgi:hypothetical protein